MTDPISVVPSDAAWPDLFRHQAACLRSALGSVAIRIDHIGSTAVPGLAAKPIIDVQVSVESLEPLNAFRMPLESLGYVYRPENLERTKRYFREPPGTRRTHIHVRQHGSWNEQFALLFRDYLRADQAVADRYAELKLALARRYSHDRQAYVDAKQPFIWGVMEKADSWAQSVGWSPGPSDA
jgi:GrpB-like predicted nucleotidyltransferase (UPF0157 family)